MGIDRRKASRNAATTWAAMLGIALATVGAAALGQAQNPSPPAPQQQEQKQQQPKPGARPRQVPRSDSSKKGTEKEEPGGLRLPPAEELPGDLADRPAADPLGPGDRNPMPGEAGQPAAPGADPNAMVVPQWPFVYEMTMASYDGSPLAIRYYPSQQGSSAPVVLLVHDLGPGRSGKDFDDPIKELDGQGLAGHLQQEGYAVFSLDLRGHGQSPSRIRGAERIPRMLGDLQAAYRFLIDRHNRRELNLSKLGVVGLGEGANLATVWVSTPARRCRSRAAPVISRVWR